MVVKLHFFFLLFLLTGCETHLSTGKVSSGTSTVAPAAVNAQFSGSDPLPRGFLEDSKMRRPRLGNPSDPDPKEMPKNDEL